MKIKILSWNVRGVNNPEKRKGDQTVHRGSVDGLGVPAGNKSPKYDPSVHRGSVDGLGVPAGNKSPKYDP